MKKLDAPWIGSPPGKCFSLQLVPSRFFATDASHSLQHQLAARLSKPPIGDLPHSQANLQRLILRMCKEHPFHSLYQVYCLNPDMSKTPGSRRNSGRLSASQNQTERAAAAQDIFDRLKQEEPSATRVRNVELLCNACVEWATFGIKDNRNFKRLSTLFSVPDIALRNLKDIKVPVMTCHVPIDPTMRYEDCVWIHRYETKFYIAGGLNCPKINECIGSDGLRYRQLVRFSKARLRTALAEYVPPVQGGGKRRPASGCRHGTSV